MQIIKGWAESVQKFGKFLFVHLDDGLSDDRIQVVIPKKICSKINVGSAVDICGVWTKSLGAQQTMELFASKCTVVGKNLAPVVR